MDGLPGAATKLHEEEDEEGNPSTAFLERMLTRTPGATIQTLLLKEGGQGIRRRLGDPRGKKKIWGGAIANTNVESE